MNIQREAYIITWCTAYPKILSDVGYILYNFSRHYTSTNRKIMRNSRILNTEILFQLLVKYIKPELICDIGTLDASHSILLRKISKQARIIAFEANPHNYENIINKGIASEANIELIRKAVSNNPGQLVFHVQKYTDDEKDQWMAGTSSILQRNKEVGDTEEVSVESVRLDDYLKAEAPGSNSIALWIDVEGAGYEVLEGIESIANNITFLQVEVETEEIWQGQMLKKDIQPLMETYGFIEIGRGKHEKQHDLVYINQSYFNNNRTKCNALVSLAVFFYYLRKWGGHILSNIMLIPFLGIWRRQ